MVVVKNPSQRSVHLFSPFQWKVGQPSCQITISPSISVRYLCTKEEFETTSCALCRPQQKFVIAPISMLVTPFLSSRPHFGPYLVPWPCGNQPIPACGKWCHCYAEFRMVCVSTFELSYFKPIQVL